MIRLGNHPRVYEGGLVTFVFGLGAFCSFPTALLQEEIVEEKAAHFFTSWPLAEQTWKTSRYSFPLDMHPYTYMDICMSMCELQ